MKSLATELTEDPNGLKLILAAVAFYGLKDKPWTQAEKAADAWDAAEAFITEAKRRCTQK